MKKFKTKWFANWAKKHKISDEILLNGLLDIEKNLSTSNLGSNLYKIRISRVGQGKRSGFRTIVAYKMSEKTIFLYGFGKNEKENISNTELVMLKKLGNDLLKLSEQEMSDAINTKIISFLEEQE